MGSNLEKYIKALCALHEDDFTKNILKPLFESMGYDRVDFNGGPYERGRDLIAQRKIPPREEMYVVYVQSKKIGKFQNTKNAALFSALIHQLRQCCLGEITDFEGNKVSPNEVFLACPEQISNRFFEELESQLFGMPVKVFPYDGPRIIADIKKYQPALIESLLSLEDKLAYNECSVQSNAELLAALKSKNKGDLKNFYSDLSFFVGSFDSNLLLHLKIEVTSDKLNLSEEKWKAFKEDHEEILMEHNFDLIEGSVGEVDQEFIKNIEIYESNKNQSLIKKHKEISERVDDLKKRINTLLGNLDSSMNPIENPLLKKLADDEIVEREAIVALLKQISQGDKNVDQFAFGSKSESFYEEARLILSMIIEKEHSASELLNLQYKIKRKPSYEAIISSRDLITTIDQCKKRYFEGVNLRKL